MDLLAGMVLAAPCAESQGDTAETAHEKVNVVGGGGGAISIKYFSCVHRD